MELGTSTIQKNRRLCDVSVNDEINRLLISIDCFDSNVASRTERDERER